MNSSLLFMDKIQVQLLNEPETTPKVTLTMGIRYAWDDIDAEENLIRYSEKGGDSYLAFYGGLVAVNRINGGGVVDRVGGNLIKPTENVSNGSISFASSVNRPFKKKMKN